MNDRIERAGRFGPQSVWSRLRSDARTRGAGHLVLVDPDRTTPERAGALAREASACAADALLVGSSTPLARDPSPVIRALREAYAGPVVLFPGGPEQVRDGFDAVLFLSLLSGRDPRFLIEAQVAAAPSVFRAGLEPIATAYVLVGDRAAGTVARVTGTAPLAVGETAAIAAHAQAAACLGFALLYLEAGSGAPEPVPAEVVRAAAAAVAASPIPIAVGGGIRRPEQASALVAAGARFVVTGTVHEEGGAVRPFTEAVHVTADALP